MAAARGVDAAAWAPPRARGAAPRADWPAPREVEAEELSELEGESVRSAVAIAVHCGTASERPATKAAAPALAAKLTFVITAPPNFLVISEVGWSRIYPRGKPTVNYAGCRAAVVSGSGRDVQTAS